jgi:hypothetical protein
MVTVVALKLSAALVLQFAVGAATDVFVAVGAVQLAGTATVTDEPVGRKWPLSVKEYENVSWVEVPTVADVGLTVIAP